MGVKKEITKKLDLVCEEQEQNLRKLGFDWCKDTPTIELAIKWFRVEHLCFIDVLYEKNGTSDRKYYGNILFEKIFHQNIIKTGYFDDYEAAKNTSLNVAIQYSLLFSSIKDGEI